MHLTVTSLKLELHVYHISPIALALAIGNTDLQS